MNASLRANPAPAQQSAELPPPVRQTPIYGLGKAVCRIAASLAFDLKASGVRNVPRTGGVLVVSNHQSFLDPVILGVAIPRAVSYLAKSELFEGRGPLGRFFGGLIRNLNAFPVRQGEGDVGAVRETIRRLQEGHVLTMFPEGGRSPSEEIEPILGGVGLIVRRAGPTVRVVPAAVHGTFRAWSRHRKLPRPSPVRVKYGPALELAHLKAAEIVKIIDTQIRRLYAELRAQHE
jgi:1-acyl-sn-glycerol-3-phosphate acyltransferase